MQPITAACGELDWMMPFTPLAGWIMKMMMMMMMANLIQHYYPIPHHCTRTMRLITQYTRRPIVPTLLVV